MVNVEYDQLQNNSQWKKHFQTRQETQFWKWLFEIIKSQGTGITKYYGQRVKQCVNAYGTAIKFWTRKITTFRQRQETEFVNGCLK